MEFTDRDGPIHKMYYLPQNVAGAGKFEATAAPNITNVDNGGINYLTGTSAAVTQNVNQGGTIVGVISSARL